MLKLTSIASNTCWYGKFPWYFPYFLHSCSFNSSIDFYIITDNQSQIDDKPENVKIISKWGIKAGLNFTPDINTQLFNKRAGAVGFDNAMVEMYSVASDRWFDYMGIVRK